MFHIAIFAIWVFAGAALTCGLTQIYAGNSKRTHPDTRDPESLVEQPSSSPPPPSSDLTTQTKSHTKPRTTTPPRRKRISAFRARQLTPTTFLVVETDDIFAEHPYIYVKLVPSANTALVVDTGCGGASTNSHVEVTSLREFIETVPLEDNDGRPLNDGGRMGYVVVLTHCHYDHILAAEQFARDSPIIQSSHDVSFISPSELPSHSLCKAFGIRTPRFRATPVAHLTPLVSPSSGGLPLGVTLFHTPGHTPDEIALWDEDEGMLYVGDTVYEWEHIIFPAEGSIPAWLSSMDFLVSVVERSRVRAPEDVQINCGHRTAMRPALDVLRGARQFMLDVLSGKEDVRGRFEKREIPCVEYVQEGGQYSLVCPEQLVLDAREGSGGLCVE